MKKLFALVLAVAMVLSLAAVSFAAAPKIASIDTNYYKYSSSANAMDFTNSAANIAYGNTVYHLLFCDTDKYVSKADQVKGLKPKTDWEMGKDLVSKVEIVKKKVDPAYVSHVYGGGSYAYFVAVTFVEKDLTTAKADVIGTITLKSSKLVEGTEIKLAANYAVGYEVMDVAANWDRKITDKSKVYNFADGKLGGIEDDEISLYGDVGYFTVNTVGQGKIVLSNDTDFNEDVAAKYPQANLDFVNGNGASFNKTGVMTLTAPEGSYLYALSADGTLKAVKADYDAYEEAFTFKTRTLGCYVISDMELTLVDAPVVSPDAPTVAPNPPMGAAA